MYWISLAAPAIAQCMRAGPGLLRLPVGWLRCKSSRQRAMPALLRAFRFHPCRCSLRNGIVEWAFILPQVENLVRFRAGCQAHFIDRWRSARASRFEFNRGLTAAAGGCRPFRACECHLAVCNSRQFVW
jgi:hypothetical protein